MALCSSITNVIFFTSFLPDIFGPKAAPPAPIVSTPTEGATQGSTGYTGSGLGSGGPRMGNFDVQKSNDIVSIGKDLIGKGFSVAEHPDFTKTPTASGGSYTPGEGTVSDVHSGRGHYEAEQLMLLIGEDLLKIQRQDIVVF